MKRGSRGLRSTSSWARRSRRSRYGKLTGASAQPLWRGSSFGAKGGTRNEEHFVRSWTSGFDLERTVELRGGLVRRRVSEATEQRPSRVRDRGSCYLPRQHAERDTREGDEDEDTHGGRDAHRRTSPGRPGSTGVRPRHERERHSDAAT